MPNGQSLTHSLTSSVVFAFPLQLGVVGLQLMLTCKTHSRVFVSNLLIDRLPPGNGVLTFVCRYYTINSQSFLLKNQTFVL